jgi:hypothetical protein
MNKTLRITLIVVIVLIGAIALLWTGAVFGRNLWGMMGGYSYGYDMGSGMMGNWGSNQGYDYSRFGYGMMGPGMMGGHGGYGMMGPGMMGGHGGYGMMGPSMMGGYGYGVSNDVEPLTVGEAREAVESYLTSFGDSDLVIEEIMIFDNNAYAIIVEESTGIGAFELLVDPVTKAVFPEYGPNMMWNLKYGMMSSFGGYGMMGPGMMMGGSGYGSMMMGNTGFGGMSGQGKSDAMSGSEDMDMNNVDSEEMDGSEDMDATDMMGGDGSGDSMTTFDVSSELPVTPEEALETAQSYLDQYYPGVEISDEITAFYGYYTIDTQTDGEIVGMLSVNGFTRQVFPHTWHGEFIEMVESDHE